MATVAEDESRGILGEEYISVALLETECTQQLRPPLPAHHEEVFLFPLGPRIRWGGLVAGVIVAFAVILLGTSLGIALGLSPLLTHWLLQPETLHDFTTPVGMWIGGIMVIAYFVAGRVSTTVTERPDGGAVLQGTLTWSLLSVIYSWLVTSSIALSLGKLPEEMQVSRPPFVLPFHLPSLPPTKADLAQKLGLTAPSTLRARLAEDHLVSALTALTPLAQEEARATLTNHLQARIAAVQNKPDALKAELRNFLSWLSTRIQQQGLTILEHAQLQMHKGSWRPFVLMAVTLFVTIIGSYTGLPPRQQWRGIATPRL